MKPLTSTLPLTESPSRSSVRERLSDYLALTKPRLSSMSVMTAFFGFLAAKPTWSVEVVLALLVGSGLAAGGAAALNMWLERGPDARMRRTADRPLAAGRLGSLEVAIFGFGLSLVGITVLWLGANPLAALLAFLTVAIYAGLYTPLKRISPWATEVGAVSGALPPLIGWACAGELSPLLGAYLFAILFFWQLPHFMSISWLYREDYRHGGFAMLAVQDERGKTVANIAWIYALLLCVLAPLPLLWGGASPGFAVAAVAVSAWQAAGAAAFRRGTNQTKAARALFLRSVSYLPLLLTLFVLDRFLLVP